MKKRLCIIILSCTLLMVACENNNEEYSDMQVSTEQEVEQGSKDEQTVEIVETKTIEDSVLRETEISVEPTSEEFPKNVETNETELNGIKIVEIVIDDTNIAEQNKEVIKDEYGIYLSNPEASTELKDITDERINISFPSFEYNKGNAQYDESVKTSINKELQLACVDDDLELLTTGDLSDLNEYQVDYKIAKSEDNLISIQYVGQLYATSNAMSFSNGITLDTITGDKKSVEEYIKIEQSLLETVKSESIEINPESGYSKDDIVYFLETFISDYENGYIDEYTCYFLDESYVNLIVPVNVGNSSYFIIKILV